MSSKKKISLVVLLVVLAYAGIYAIGYRNSLEKIDAFCGAIDSSTLTDDLPRLASTFDVDLRGPREDPQKVAVSIYMAASAYTMGEYRCSVEATPKYVMRKILPSGSKVDVRTELDTNSIQIAVEQIFFLQEKEGELGVTSEIQDCYERIRSTTKDGHAKADICIAQDIAYSYYADSIYRQFAEWSGKPQVKIQSPFTQLESVNRRALAALSEMRLTQQEAKERVTRLTQAVQDSINPAPKKVTASPRG